ncbi:hypothetical protein N9L19_01400 [bacterium]|nr:hypothetical protein [bacterium]
MCTEKQPLGTYSYIHIIRIANHHELGSGLGSQVIVTSDPRADGL